MLKTTRVLLPLLLFICCFQHLALSQSEKNDSLSGLIETSIDSTKTTPEESKFDKAELENKLKQHQLDEANFQLVAILLMSIIIVVFIIVYYFLRSKRNITEIKAQELQIEALEKRLLELQLNHEGIEKTIDLSELNKDLRSPLTEREIETLLLSIKGLPYIEIAEKLFISVIAVKDSLMSIYKKLDVKGKKQVINYVVKS